MRRTHLLFSLLTLAGALPACFAPDGMDDGASESGVATEGEAPADTGLPASETGAGDAADGSTGATDGAHDATTDTGEMTDGAEETDGVEETGNEADTDTDGDETGEVCDEELGTEANCLDCGDTCALGQECSLGGCASPANVGFDEPFTGVGGYPNQLYGFAIDLDDDGWLQSFNFQGVGNGGAIQLALYDDAGGAPGALLAASDVLESYGAGNHSLAATPMELEAGTYWLMARNTTPSQIGLDFEPDVVPPSERVRIFLDFGEELPEQMGPVDTIPSFEINLWITILQ